MKKCRIKKTENGYAVRGTNFLHHSDADMYAYYLAIVLNNGGKLIFVASVEEAIEKHNQLEGESNEDWLRVCWRSNAGCYLHTKNIYALKDNRIQDNPYQWYKDADQWWEYMPNEIKAVISGIGNQIATDYHYRAYWAKIQPSDKNCIDKYLRQRKGLIRVDEDDANSLQREVVGELEDFTFEQE